MLEQPTGDAAHQVAPDADPVRSGDDQVAPPVLREVEQRVARRAVRDLRRDVDPVGRITGQSGQAILPVLLDALDLPFEPADRLGRRHDDAPFGGQDVRQRQRAPGRGCDRGGEPPGGGCLIGSVEGDEYSAEGHFDLFPLAGTLGLMVTPLAIAGNAPVLLELGAILLGLSLLARLADRLQLSPIPLYLLAGVVLGRIGGGPVSFPEEVVEIGAGVGLVLLLFTLGLEYAGDELAASMREGFGAGALDAALNFVPGIAAGLLFGWSVEASVLLGGVTYVTSSGIAAKVMSDLGRFGSPETPAIISLLVMEDLAMALYLPLVAVLLAGLDPLSAVALLALAALAAVSSVVLAVRHGGRLSGILSARSDEVLLLTTLGFVLLVAGAAEGARLSAAVGAFLAGIVLSDPVAARARELVAPLRDLFAAAFFLFFALEIDVAAIPSVAPLALALGVVTTATKLATGSWAAARVGADGPGRLRAGTTLIARGEFRS